jgi:hypothetical protein
MMFLSSSPSDSMEILFVLGHWFFQSLKSLLLWPQNSHELETDGSSITNFHDRVIIGFLNQNIKMFSGLKDIQRDGLNMN